MAYLHDPCGFWLFELFLLNRSILFCCCWWFFWNGRVWFDRLLLAVVGVILWLFFLWNRDNFCDFYVVMRRINMRHMNSCALTLANKVAYSAMSFVEYTHRSAGNICRLFETPASNLQKSHQLCVCVCVCVCGQQTTVFFIFYTKSNT